MALTHTAPVSINPQSWTLLNTGGVITGGVTIAPLLGSKIFIAPTATAVAPVGLPMVTPGVIELGSHPEGILGLTMTQIWPGFPTGAHVYAYSDFPAMVTVNCGA